MATRNKLNDDTDFAQDATTTTNDDYPEEFQNDDTTPQGATDTTTSPGLSDDELDDFVPNDERDERERKKFITPQGDWVKTDKFKLTKVVKQDDSEPGDVNPDGRTFYNLSGKPQTRLIDGIDWEPTLFYSMSPDFRVDQYRDNGQGDKPYKMWCQARDLYIAIYGRKAKSAKEVLLMCIHDEYTIKTGNYDGRPNVQFLKKRQTNRR